MFDYISVREASEKWKISERRGQKLCEQTRIEGVQRFGNCWMIPRLAKKPDDLCKKNAQGLKKSDS